MLVCDLCLHNPAILVVSGLSDVLGAIGRILLSYLVHMHNSLRSLRQGQVHVGPITWEVLPHLRQEKRASFHLRHDDRVKKGAPHYLNSYPCPFPLSLSCHRDQERGYSEKDPSQRRKRAPSPPTDQGFEGCALRGLATAIEHSGSEPFTDQGFEGWPLGRVRQPPRARRVRDDPGYVRYMAEARATLPRYPRKFPRPAGMICNGIPPEGGIEPSDPIEWVRVRQITCMYFWSAPLGH
jgi:hypothetical protein